MPIYHQPTGPIMTSSGFMASLLAVPTRSLRQRVYDRITNLMLRIIDAHVTDHQYHSCDTRRQLVLTSLYNRIARSLPQGCTEEIDFCGNCESMFYPSEQEYSNRCPKCAAHL